MPRLLQLAVTAQTYRDAMVFASPPPWVQRLLFGAIAPVGRLLGRRAIYERVRRVARARLGRRETSCIRAPLASMDAKP